MSYTLKINTILHTKDGSKIGNAIIVGQESFYWIIKTDYGNECKFTEEEIEEFFKIAWIDYTIEKDAYTCEQMQLMMSKDHKHRV